MVNLQTIPFVLYDVLVENDHIFYFLNKNISYRNDKLNVQKYKFCEEFVFLFSFEVICINFFTYTNVRKFLNPNFVLTIRKSHRS